MQEYLTTEEVAEIIKLKPATVRKYFQSGKIKAEKINNSQWRTIKANVDAYINKNKEATDV